MMDWSDYGPFATTSAIVAALASLFSLLMIKTVGRLYRWTWLIHGTFPFVVRAAAQGPAIALIVLTWLRIDEDNYHTFAVGALVFGLAATFLVFLFERYRKVHVVRIPVTSSNGTQQVDSKGRLVFDNVVIGTAQTMLPGPAHDYYNARRRVGGLSIPNFMSGYGRSVNDPEAIWDRSYLASISNNLTMLLVGIVLACVLALHLSASSIEVAIRPDTVRAIVPEEISE